MKKTVWFDARGMGKDKLIALVNTLRYEQVLLDIPTLNSNKFPSRTKFVVAIKKKEELKELPKNVVILSSEEEILKTASEFYETAYYIQVEDKESMNRAWSSAIRYPYLVVEFRDSTNIPLELLIARLQHKGTRILKVVHTVEEAKIAFGVMEVGSSGVVLGSRDEKEIKEMSDYMGYEALGKLELKPGTVKEVQHIAMGYRSCVDTTTLMEQNEGMIIGSTASGGILVSSETHELPYMELRPFRVNAGAVHSYIWGPDNTTSYLSELKAGDTVLCVDTQGNTREVSVGRVKTEIRPLVKILLDVDGVQMNTILQDDWHIRVFGADKTVKNVSDIEAGDRLLAYRCSAGRHVGLKIEENLIEK